MAETSVRVRFAPSPTGLLHAGSARTALFNFLFAKKYKGSFILRVEDTDDERNKEEYLKEQLSVLSWLGLHWDEGPKINSLFEFKGNSGPYRQSQRRGIYKKYAELLLEKQSAYYCFLTDDEIKEMKSEAVKKNKPHRVISPYRNWSTAKALEKKRQGAEAVVRFKMPEEKKEYKINDLVRGEVSFPSDMSGDFVLMRSDGRSVYNFCCAVDDALMGITHVLRAEEHLANTLRQLAVFSALGFSPPRYGHLSLILDERKKKLSKRTGAKSCQDYKDSGILPSSLNNFLALLGWNPKDENEIFNLNELAEKFSQNGLNSAPAVFDEKKLKWINTCHIRKMSDDELLTALEPLFLTLGLDLPSAHWWKKLALSSLKSSFSNLKEGARMFRLFSRKHYSVEEEGFKIAQWEKTFSVLKGWQSALENSAGKEYLSIQDFEQIKNKIKEDLSVEGKFLFMPLRLAMIGKLKGLELNQTVVLIERRELIRRVKILISSLPPAP